MVNVRSGAALAAIPHLLILLVVVTSAVNAPAGERGYVAYLILLELLIVPFGLLAAVVVRFIPRLRAWSGGILAGTVGGAALVVLAIFLAGASDNW
ncbi:hypothetical protein [Actinoplanes sp. DH11]|uniref:hypothetical protein n=1 Tax=Actinoplanes sp. DH11 TaxID=2857011 RepID=UPI001E4984C2|nr:hypothetical protein [Actinoplanes sp. DH11]